MRRLFSYIVVGLIALSSVSCISLAINEIETNIEEKRTLYVEHVSIYLENMTQSALIVEYNRDVYGFLNVLDVAHVAVPPNYLLCLHIDDLTYVYKFKRKVYKDSHSLYDIDDDYCRKYLRDLRDDSYIKIYDTDSVLLKEWDIRSYDPAEPNPFDCNYYDYSLYDEQYGTYHEWVFVITEDMLNR